MGLYSVLLEARGQVRCLKDSSALAVVVSPASQQIIARMLVLRGRELSRHSYLNVLPVHLRCDQLCRAWGLIPALVPIVAEISRFCLVRPLLQVCVRRSSTEPGSGRLLRPLPHILHVLEHELGLFWHTHAAIVHVLHG